MNQILGIPVIKVSCFIRAYQARKAAAGSTASSFNPKGGGGGDISRELRRSRAEKNRMCGT